MESIEREKSELLERLLRHAARAGILVYLPSVAACIWTGLYFLAAVDTLAFLLLLVIAFSKRLSFETKLIIVIGGGLAVGALVLFQTGRDGAGYIWLIFGIAISALFGDRRAVIVTISLSGAILAAYALSVALGILAVEQPLLPLLVIVSNLALICAVLAFIIVRLTGGLGLVIHEKEALADRLRVELAATEDARARLAHSLETKEILLRELEHRVRNNIQVITSLAWLENQRSKTAASSEGRGARSASEALASMLRKIHAISIVNDLFLADPEATTVELADMVRSIAAHAREGRGGGERPITVTGFRCKIELSEALAFCLATSEVLDALCRETLPEEIALVHEGGRRILTLGLPPGLSASVAQTAIAQAAADPTIGGIVNPETLFVSAPPAEGRDRGARICLVVPSTTEPHAPLPF